MSSRNQKPTSRSEVVRQRRSEPERKVTLPESKPASSRPGVANVWQPVNRQPVQPIRHQSVPSLPLQRACPDHAPHRCFTSKNQLQGGS